MNSRSCVRLTLHLSVIAAALGLGFAVRAMLPAPAPVPLTTESSAAPAAPPAEVPALFAEGGGRPLAGYTPAESSALRERLASLSRSANPVRDQLLMRAELLSGISTAADFQRALELLQASGCEASFRMNMIVAMAGQLAEKDPASAATATGLVQDREFRARATSQVMAVWAKRDPEAALAFAATQGAGFKATALHAIFQELARRDPAAAMARTADFKHPGYNYGLDRTVISEWWQKDPASATAWVQTRSGTERLTAIRSLLEVAAYSDPAAAWKLIQSAPAAERPGMWDMTSLLSAWAQTDPSAAVSAVLSEPDATRRAGILQHLGRTMKLVEENYAGEGRAKSMLSSLPDEASRQQFLYGLAQGWLYDGGRRDFPAVLEFTAQLKDESRRLEMIKNTGAVWAREDAPAASEWLNTLPPGTDRDAAIGEFVRGTFDSDPAAALSWSASIADEGKRGRRLAELYPKWVQKDAAAAAAWLAQQGQLSASDRTALEAATTAR